MSRTDRTLARAVPAPGASTVMRGQNGEQGMEERKREKEKIRCRERESEERKEDKRAGEEVREG